MKIQMRNCDRQAVAPQSSRSVRRGLTLIEVLIATTLTLLLMLSLAQGFKSLSDGVSEGRAKINLSDQLRGMATMLRSDLERRTTSGSSPQDYGAAKGYFKYLDGHLTDYTATVYNRPSTFADPGQLLTASNWGDVDDVLMFTARARPGESFRGTIPRALLRYHAYNTDSSSVNLGSLDWEEEWGTDVPITSELAEIVWFMVPIADIGDGTGVVGPVDSWTDLIAVVDVDGDGSLDTDGMPDQMALCRRVLLIRDDLLITPPDAASQRASVGTVAEHQFYMRPIQPTAGNPVSFKSVCSTAYQRCDLSVTTELVNGSSGTLLVYKANSLSTLQDPQNRFAHGVYPVQGSSGVVGSTLPVLFRTTGSPRLTAGVYNAALQLISASPEAVVPDAGFIPQDFMRRRYLKSVGGDVLASRVQELTMEEIVATNVVAFDLKGFDSTAVVVYHPGPDNAWGTRDFDDDGDGTVDNSTEAGWVDSDDLTLTTGDPGFWEAISFTAGGGAAPIEASRGAYVDMGWAIKGLGYPNLTSIPNGNAAAAFLVSDYSGVDASSSGFTPARYLLLGGGLAYSPGVRVFQTAFDSSTTDYESDGELVGTLNNTRVYPHGLRKYGITVPLLGADPVGQDAPPAFPVDMPSIQATIPVEDRTARTLQQISVIESLKN